MASVVDSHKAPDTIDFNWQHSGNKNFRWYKGKVQAPLLGCLPPRQNEAHDTILVSRVEMVADICNASIYQRNQKGGEEGEWRKHNNNKEASQIIREVPLLK